MNNVMILFLIFGSTLSLHATYKTVHPKEPVLQFLYGNKIGRFLKGRLISGPFNVFTGWMMNTRISRFLIPRFIKKHNISLDEALIDKVGGYKTFNDFFTRRLKPSARSINMAVGLVTSPADGAVSIIENIALATEFFVKNLSLNLETFIGDQEMAHQYEHGTLVMIRLAPWDYHRYHFPCDARATKAQRIRGSFESVNPIAYFSSTQSLEVNERQLITVTAAWGEFLFVPVGALCVGKIINTYSAEKYYNKGDEMGYFEFGGSTIVLLFKKGSFIIAESFKQATLLNEVPVKMGQALGKIGVQVF